MKIKNINLLEQHVEKITLAVAAAAALYLGYSSLTTPVTVTTTIGGREQTVQAGQVEDVVSTATRKLNFDMTKVDEKLPSVDPVAYVDKYKSQQKAPLNEALMANVPAFAPLNVSATNSIQGPQREQSPIVTPTIPPPEAVHAVASHGLIIKVKPAVAAVVPATTGPAPVDANWVKVEASFPMLALKTSYANVGGKPEESLPAVAQRITFYRVEVQRQEKLATGDWSDWKPVPAIQIALPPDVDKTALDSGNIQHTLDLLDEKVTTILTPPFYVVVPTSQAPAPAAGTRPAVRTGPTAAEMKAIEDIKRQKDEATRLNGTRLPRGATRSGAAGGGGSPSYLTPSGGTPIVRTAVPAGGAPMPTMGGGPPIMPPEYTAPANPYMNGGGPPPFLGGPMGTPEADANKQNQTVQGLQEQATVPIWFYDDSVLPEHDYKYQMRVELYNPTYHFPLPLKEPKFKEQAWLASDWVAAAAPVHIEPVQQFFVVNGIGNGSIGVKIYQWHQGRIVADEQTISPGLTIGHLRTVDGIDFSTGYTVVDVQDRNHDSSVVLLSPTGQLVTRDLQSDLNDPKRIDLDEKSRRALPAPGAMTPGGPGAVAPGM